MPEPKRSAAEGSAKEADDAALVGRCQRDADDVGAFEALYRRYAARVYGRLRGLLSDTAEAEDGLQMVFLAAFRNIKKFDGRASFAAWLQGFAVHVAQNSWRSRRRRTQAMSSYQTETAHRGASAPSPEARAAAAEETARLGRYLDALSPEARAAFVLYYVEQQELSEVAAQIGVSTQTAWGRIRRARAAVLLAMEEEEEAR